MTAGQSEGYSHARHIAQVQAAARRAGVKGGAFAVLAYLCASCDFKRPEVLRSKKNIVERTGYSLDTVKTALASLRALGFIVPIAYETGGRERATVYRVTTGKNGLENSPPIRDKGVEFSPEKGGNFSSERGGKIPPPSVSSSGYSFRREKGGAYSAGRASAPLDAGQGASRGAAQDLTTAQREELQTFAQDVKRHGYGEARRLQIERQRSREGGNLP